jgi:endonuclease/exonuclease/phosphatase family metal-dependent hydrolase
MKSAMSMHTTAPTVTSVPASAFHKTSLFGKREWQAKAEPTALKSSSASSPRTLSIATYNVWFNNMVNDVRYPAIAKLLAAMGADIVCLQEVNQSFLKYLKADAVIRATYTCLGANGETISGGAFHGCLMLVKRTTLTAARGALTNLPDTRDHRKLLSVQVSGIAGQLTEGIRDITVATAHLESPGADYAEGVRRLQLQFVKERLPANGAIFCGDMNLCNEGEECLPEEYGFRDAWTDAGNSADSPTSDSLYKSIYTPRRIDRVLYTGDAVCATEASLFGEAPIEITEPIQARLYLSDHKGVLVKLEL